MSTEWTEDQKKVIGLKDRNILVSAAAGSGKTAVLVERIIRIITDSENPVDVDKLVVVTFTKAAAAEMKTRVGAAIDRELDKDPDNEHMQRQATLLHNAQITTIDSFCQNIIKNYFHVINLDPVFKVGDKEEFDIMKIEVLDELLEKKYEASKGKKDDRFLKFVEVFAPGRTDSNIEKLVLDLYKTASSYPWPEDWLDECVEIYNVKTLEELQQLEWAKELLSYIQEVIDDYYSMAKQTRSICMESDGPETYLAAIESDIEQIAQLKECKTLEELSDAFSKVNVATLSKKRCPTASAEKKEKVKSLREVYMKKGIKGLKDEYFYQSMEGFLSDIMEIAPLIEELINLTKEFMQAFADRKREEGLLDFSDMEHFALEILVDRDEEGVRPSEVARELQEHYYEIMTDEYQDSNYVQELILGSLSRAPERKPYLFMVGDVKQSIYQFRLARPDIFIGKYNEYSLEDGKYQRIDLHQNFRSRTCVLEPANLIFRKIMQESLGGIVYDDAASLVPGRVYEETDKKTADKMDVIIIDEKVDEDTEKLSKKSLEAVAIGQKIREMVQGNDPLYVSDKGGYRKAEYRDIVILLRSINNWSEEFIETLTDMGIPAYSETKTGYFSALEICTVLDMLKVIDNPRQDIPLVAVMRSCIAGISDEELAVIGALPHEIDYFDAVKLILQINKDEEVTKTYRKFIVLDDESLLELQKKLESFCEMLDRYREMSQYSSVYEILRAIYDDTDYYNIMSAMPAGEKRAANLNILLQRSIEFAENGHQGIFAFTRYIENLRKANIDFGEAQVNGENTNAVRIMSIHKSKGLQFPVVFVAGMGKSFNYQDIKKTTIISPDFGIGTDFIDLELRVKQPTLIKKFMTKYMQKNILAEEIRILYVALTRAEEKLILTGTVSDIEKKQSKWEQNSKNISMSMLISSTTYFDWVMPVLYSEGIENSSLFDVRFLGQEDILENEASNIQEMIADRSALDNFDTEQIYDNDIYNLLEQQKNNRYMFESEQGLPIKISVTELKRAAGKKAAEVTEDDFEEVFAEDIVNEEEEQQTLSDDISRPEFLKETKEITGAARGTLYHLVMEKFPYDEICEGYDFGKMLADMVDKGYMSEKDAEILDIRKFQKFAGSSMFKRMKKALDNGLLRREQPFMTGVKARELYDFVDKSSEEIVVVQGIIDAFFEEGDEIVLVDYKTDYVSRYNKQELIEKYRVQLDYYAKALEKITKKKVKEKIIYSFALGEEIRVE